MVDPKRISFLFDLWVLRILRAILSLGIATAVGILVLLVVLGLELMDTLRNYFIEHRLRVEFLISVALIAVARHIIQLDYERASPWLVGAIALLVLSLAASYVAVRAFQPRKVVSGPEPR